MSSRNRSRRHGVKKYIFKGDKMQLCERLSQLVGHEVIISRHMGVEEQATKEGILEEVGRDYIIIRPFDTPDWPLDSIEEYSEMGGHWFIKLNEAMPIVHTRGCRECSAKSTVNQDSI